MGGHIISIKASHDCGMTMPQASDVVGLSVWSRGRLSHWKWLGFAWEIGPSPRPKSKNTSPQNHPKPRLSTIYKGLALDVCDHYQLFISSLYYCTVCMLQVLSITHGRFFSHVLKSIYVLIVLSRFICLRGGMISCDFFFSLYFSNILPAKTLTLTQIRHVGDFFKGIL